MTADECNARASNCAANAAVAENQFIALEFLSMAAQWRAMAVRDISLGQLSAPIDVLAALNTLPMLPDHSG
jgi:hypothetical protein